MLISLQTMASAVGTAMRHTADTTSDGAATPPVPLGAALAKAAGVAKDSSGTPGADSSSGTGASPSVQALRKQIERLQKQLSQQEQQLRLSVSGRQANDPAQAARIAALQSAVATTVGQLSEAVARLAAVLMAEGGGSGSLVHASA